MVKVKNNKLKIKSINAATLLLITSSCLFLGYAGCGKKATQNAGSRYIVQKQNIVTPAYVPPAPTPKYVYGGNFYRDPFTPVRAESSNMSLAASNEPEVMTSEKLAALQLKGLMGDKGTGSLALIASPDGSSYILKNGKLYDRKNRVVKDVSGIIEKNFVTLYCGNTKVELTLKNPKEETK